MFCDHPGRHVKKVGAYMWWYTVLVDKSGLGSKQEDIVQDTAHIFKFYAIVFPYS